VKAPRFALFVLSLALLSLGAPAQQPAKAPAKTQEQSVKPGINETWKSENIAPLVDTLEAESREIYTERVNLAAIVGPKPGTVVADIGAGSGFMAEEFARRVGPQGRVYAVDINPRLLDFVSQRAKQHSLANLLPVLTPEDSVALPANSVDMVFICDTYHHFEYPRGTMTAIHRALRPGGQLVIVDFVRIPGQSPQWVMEHVRAGMDEVVKEITSFGFELTNVHNPPFLESNYVIRFRRVERPN